MKRMRCVFSSMGVCLLLSFLALPVVGQRPPSAEFYLRGTQLHVLRTGGVGLEFGGRAFLHSPTPGSRQAVGMHAWVVGEGVDDGLDGVAGLGIDWMFEWRVPGGTARQYLTVPMEVLVNTGNPEWQMLEIVNEGPVGLWVPDAPPTGHREVRQRDAAVAMGVGTGLVFPVGDQLRFSVEGVVLYHTLYEGRPVGERGDYRSQDGLLFRLSLGSHFRVGS